MREKAPFAPVCADMGSGPSSSATTACTGAPPAKYRIVPLTPPSAVGVADGVDDGVRVGVADGVGDGVRVGVADGVGDGVRVGVDEVVGVDDDVGVNVG